MNVKHNLSISQCALCLMSTCFGWHILEEYPKHILGASIEQVQRELLDTSPQGRLWCLWEVTGRAVSGCRVSRGTACYSYKIALRAWGCECQTDLACGCLLLDEPAARNPFKTFQAAIPVGKAATFTTKYSLRRMALRSLAGIPCFC